MKTILALLFLALPARAQNTVGLPICGVPQVCPPRSQTFDVLTANFFVGDGSQLTDIPGVSASTIAVNAAQFTGNGAQASPLNAKSSTFTLQGNAFNAANQLVQLDGSARLPAVDGSQLTNVTASVDHTTGTITSGKFGDNRVAISSGAIAGFGPPTVSSLTVVNGPVTAAGSSVTASAFFGDGSHLTGVNTSVDHTTGTITSGKFGDDRVAISTGAVTSGKFGDDKVGISSGAILGFGPPTVSTMTVIGGSFSVATSTLVIRGGNVGIGETNPSTLLYIKGDGDSTGPTRYFQTFNNTHGNAGDRQGWQFINQGFGASAGFATQLGPGGGSATLEFLQNGNPAIHVDGNGLVTIGGSSPTEKLTVMNGGASFAGAVAIGIMHPAAALHISTTIANPADIDSGVSFIDRYSDDTLTGAYIGRKARGTSGSPTAAQAGDDLAAFGGRAYDGAKFSTSSIGLFRIISEENQTATAWGTYFAWLNSAAGSNLRREVMRLNSAGQLGIGTTAPTETLHVGGTAKVDTGLIVSSITWTGGTPGKATCTNAAGNQSGCTSAVDISGNCTCP